MTQFALNTQNFGSPVVGTNFGDRNNQVNKQNGSENNGFNSLLSGLMSPNAERPQFSNPFGEMRDQQQFQPQPMARQNNYDSAQDVAEQSSTNDVLDYNSPDSILSQNTRVQHHHQAEETNKTPKEHVRDSETNQQLAENNAETSETAHVAVAEYVVDEKNLKHLNKATVQTSDVTNPLLNGNLINPTAIEDVVEDLGVEVANSAIDVAEMSAKIADLKALNAGVSPSKNLIGQDEIDALLAQNTSKQRAKNAEKIDANKLALLQQLSPETLELVKDKITVKQSALNNPVVAQTVNANLLGQTSKTSTESLSALLANNLLNSNNTKKTTGATQTTATPKLSDIINSAKESQAQTMLDSLNIMLNADTSDNYKSGGVNGLSSALMADLELKSQQYLASKGQLNIANELNLSELSNLNVNLSSLQNGSSVNHATPTNASTFTPNFSLNTPFGNPLWGQALNEQMQYFLSKNMSEVQLTLNPQNLGPIDIKMTLNAQSELAVRFMTQHADVQKALEANMSQLQSTLSDKGIVLTSSVVQTVGNSNEANLQQNNQGQAQADLNNQQGQQQNYQASENSNNNAQDMGFSAIAEEVGLNPIDKQTTRPVDTNQQQSVLRSQRVQEGLDLFA